MSDIAELLERCRKATGPDRAVDLLVHALVAQAGEWSDGDIAYALTDIEGTTAPPSYTANIDSITALIERELPGCLLSLIQMPAQWQATIVEVDPDHPDAVAADYYEDAPTAPLAMVCAFLSAKLAQVTE